jgi:MoxR-like ATPase
VLEQVEDGRDRSIMKGTASLSSLADDLLIDEEELADRRAARDEAAGRVYGPPGTGKTFVARKLAAVP